MDSWCLHTTTDVLCALALCLLLWKREALLTRL